jgi:hypothetical protein
VFARVFGQDPDFFAFYRSMQAYTTALEEDTTMVMSPDSSFLQFLKNPNSVLAPSQRGTVKRGKRVDVAKLTAKGRSLSDSLCPEIAAKAKADAKNAVQ